MNKILVVGAGGQLGIELVEGLRQLHGAENTIASDLKPFEETQLPEPYITLDATDATAVKGIIEEHNVTQIYHLAAILSAKGEKNPLLAWDINMRSLLTILEVGKMEKVEKIFWPSSIAVFGPDTPKTKTPQTTTMNPNTVYGISKLAGEQWCEYYFRKFGVDIRSLRYPGLIGYKTLPGGGTTDYAVDIYHKAIKGEVFNCFLDKDTRLPMMYMKDAVKATIDLMQAPSDRLTVRSSYNVAGMSFTPQEIFQSVRSHFPDFQIVYDPDYRQNIAESWPESIDDSTARSDWGWEHNYDLNSMTEDILSHLSQLLS